MAMKKTTTGNLILLHFIVFIFGFTGILGKLITIDSGSLVWWRIAIALVGISVFIKLSKITLRLPQRAIVNLMTTGVITAVHWITFFEAIKVANVSVALACLSTSAFFTALIEPIFFRRKISSTELLLGLGIIVGLTLIFSFETQYTLGIILALIAAFLAAVFTVLNGIFIRSHKPSQISFYEMLGGLIAVSLYLLWRNDVGLENLKLITDDIIWLLILGLVCTAFAFVASVKVMETIRPFTVALSINLEPVYGIILAWLIFGESEKMSVGFYSGAFVILAILIFNAYWQKKTKKKPWHINPSV